MYIRLEDSHDEDATIHVDVASYSHTVQPTTKSTHTLELHQPT